MEVAIFLLGSLAIIFFILYLSKVNRNHKFGTIVMKETIYLSNNLYYIDVTYYNGSKTITTRVEVDSATYTKFEVGDKTLI